MCVILLVLKKQNNEKLNNVVLNNLREFSLYNRDGAAVMALTRDKKKELILNRALNYNHPRITEIVKNNDFINIHLRQATKGKRSVENCHLWEKNGWLFAHNGTISDMGSEEVCDSLEFFNSLVIKKAIRKNTINHEQILKYFYESQFTGRCLLYNIKLKVAYLFGNYKAFLLNRNYLIIASTDIETKEIINLFNLRFETEQEYNEPPVIEKLETEIDGLNLIDYKTENIYHLAERYELETTINCFSATLKKITQKERDKNTLLLEDIDAEKDPITGKSTSEMNDKELSEFYGYEDYPHDYRY